MSLLKKMAKSVTAGFALATIATTAYAGNIIPKKPFVNMSLLGYGPRSQNSECSGLGGYKMTFGLIPELQGIKIEAGILGGNMHLKKDNSFQDIDLTRKNISLYYQFPIWKNVDFHNSGNQTNLFLGFEKSYFSGNSYSAEEPGFVVGTDWHDNIDGAMATMKLSYYPEIIFRSENQNLSRKNAGGIFLEIGFGTTF